MGAGVGRAFAETIGADNEPVRKDKKLWIIPTFPSLKKVLNSN